MLSEQPNRTTSCLPSKARVAETPAPIAMGSSRSNYPYQRTIGAPAKECHADLLVGSRLRPSTGIKSGAAMSRGGRDEKTKRAKTKASAASCTERLNDNPEV